MGITLLDLYAITGLPLSYKTYQESDFEGEEVAFEADPNRRNFFRRRRNATPTNEDVTVLDHDPEKDDHMTLNELLHNILPVCHATPIATMDNSGKRVPFGLVEETERNSGAEASNVLEEENVAQ
ncbi:hypothetical protein ACLB2K_014260 [Fragaria x ananassa]